MPGKYGEKVVIRIIDNRNVPGEPGEAGLRLRDAQAAGASSSRSPTASCWSPAHRQRQEHHALHRACRNSTADDVNICTVEDPVEYNLPGVNQFQVNEKIGFTFAAALRSLLRQDPDIIMVGEIRDDETARIAVQAALTGHLVLSHAAHQRRPRRRSRACSTSASSRTWSAPPSAACWPSGWCARSAQLQGAVRAAAQRSAGRSRSSAGDVETLYRGHGLPQVPQQRLLRPNRHLRAARARRRHDRAHQPGASLNETARTGPRPRA